MERYDEYKDSGVEWIGEIPAGWEVRPAKRCIIIRNGSDPKSLGDTPVYGSGGNSFKTCGEFKDGPAVLLGRKGTINVPQWVEGKYWNVDTAFDVVSIENTMILRYYFYQAQCFDYERYGTQTALPSMAQSDYRNMLIVCPDITSQAAIVRYLDSETTRVDSLIADCEREVELLQEYRKAVISEAVTKGLDPNVPMKDSGIEWIGAIPVSWETARLDKIAVRKSGHTPDKKVPEYWDGDIVWVSLADSPALRTNKYISTSTTMTTREGIAHSSAEVLPAGSVLLSRDASVGLTAIAGVPLAVSQHFMAYICGDNLSNEYLRYVFLAMRQEFERLSMGSTIPTIGLPLVKQFVIPYPLRKVQDAIVAYLDEKTAEIDALIADYQSMADKLREYRKSLISEAVTGKFKVPGV